MKTKKIKSVIKQLYVGIAERLLKKVKFMMNITLTATIDMHFCICNSYLLFKMLNELSCLTLFQARQGQFDPQHHVYVCSFYKCQGNLTKIGDFVFVTI